ncbi:phage holin family protein [Fictibacillus terranigra]|uniref:Phage holin family protein n=1 Tax=Fictibacillus terranigra TaxID=3058424 RepID=A0ABT8E2L2_9BACL|nr:phage holin family protein [Fictibacillus sp. CENA-BCM004]MDN4072116.1 phage holin family protein [Fictibacillus sp. CENA-BCM004]
MFNWFISLLVNTVVLMVVAGYYPPFHLEGAGAAFLASVILSIFNLFIKPILVLLTLPVTVLTFGLFLIVINAILLMLTAQVMGDQFDIDGFGAAFLAAIIIAILNLLIQNFIIEPMQKKKRSN